MEDTQDIVFRKKSRLFKLFLIGSICIFFVVFFIKVLPGSKVENGDTFTIEKGSTVISVTKELKENDIIRSPFLFHLSVIFLGDNKVMAGTYALERNEPVFSLARRLGRGEYNLDLVRVTVPEGFSNIQIADLLDSKIEDFNKLEFLSLVEGKSGYLFPDTYFFLPNEDVKKIVFSMEDNFKRKTLQIRDEALGSGKNFSDIIKMASLIEREAKTEEERYMISGILWKRIAIGMPLQVDAVFSVINGKGSSELSLADLKEDSPYNLYTRLGLPPSPIVNPGLDSIMAALNPKDSPYLYYLHGNDQVIRYARTHDEHVFNKSKYIK